MRSQQLFIIDDDDDLRSTLVFALRGAGLDVLEFASAEDALRASRAASPGAVLLDYRIDGMTAEDFVATLRTLVEPPPVVLLSGAHDVADVATRIGALDWLAKPCAYEQLVERARHALSYAR